MVRVEEQFLGLAFCLSLVLGSVGLCTGQEQNENFSQPDYFFQGALSEATDEVVRRDVKFMLFVFDPLDTALAGYYLDTLFNLKEIASTLNRNFVCIAADTASVKGSTLKTQFRLTQFPTILFADRKGQEFYSAYGRLEADQMFDICERAVFK